MRTTESGVAGENRELEQMDRPRVGEVDLDALAHNLGVLEALAGRGVRVIPALKANAYGHGVGPVAARLGAQGVRLFSTGSVEDALAIREAVPGANVLVFGGPLPEGVGRLVELGLMPSVYDRALAEAVSRAARAPVDVWVKVDTGMGRLGVSLDRARQLVRETAALENVRVHGVYTHLPFSDGAELPWVRARLAEFDALLEALATDGIEVPVSQALASTGVLAGLKTRANAVCTGYALFGVAPPALGSEAGRALQPVLTAIRSRLIHVHVPARTRPGAPTGRRVGVIPLGLVDGYGPLPPDVAACALVRGRRVPVRGVSLEYTSLDLSELDAAEVGDEVVVLGGSGDARIPLEELATWHGLRPHQLLMALDRKLPLRHRGAPGRA